MLKILLVDDEPVNLRVLDSMLARGDFALLEAATGEECLELVRRERPDIVLLDVVLPGHEYTIYGLSWHHAGIVRNSGPYELYAPYSTARNDPGLLAALAASASSHAELCAALPADADPDLPICRDVWQQAPGGERGFFKQTALDIVFPPHLRAPGFPLRANVLLFSHADALQGRFTHPASVELNVRVCFDKNV